MCQQRMPRVVFAVVGGRVKVVDETCFEDVNIARIRTVLCPPHINALIAAPCPCLQYKAVALMLFSLLRTAISLTTRSARSGKRLHIPDHTRIQGKRFTEIKNQNINIFCPPKSGKVTSSN